MAIKTDTFTSTGGGGGAVTSVNTFTGAVVLSANDLAADHTATNYTATNANIDGHLSGIDSKLGTIAAGLTYKGTFNATAGTPDLSSALKGDLYVIDTAGTIYGQTWAVGDHLLINADMGGTITNSKIDKIDNTDQVTSVNTLTGAVVLSANDLAADHTAVNYTAANANIDGHLSGIDSALGASANPTLNDVTTNGDTTTNAINVGTITTSGDILADSGDTRTIGDEDTRFITYYGDMNGAIRFKAKNDHGSQITKGQVVYIKGLAGDGTTPTVGLADADDSAKMPAFGLAFNTANDQAEVQIVSFGNLGGLNTSTFAVGDTLFVDTTAGGLTKTKPTGETAQLQNIGRVIRSNNGGGVIMVGGAGRSAATPNLDQDKVFLGNASNQSVSTALSSIGLSKFNNDSGFLTNINSESLNDLSDVSFTAGAGIDNYVLTYDNGTSTWGAEAAPTAAAASETVAGVIEIATNAEASAATATDKALVPSNISSLDLSAMNNTTSAFISGISGESLNDLSDVSFTAGAGIDNYVLTYDNGTSTWGAELVPSAPVTSVNTLTGAVVVSGNDIAADHTAVNYTAANANVDGHFSGIDTKLGTLISDITGESLNDLSDVSFTAGAGIDNYVLTYDNGTSTWGAEAAPTAAAASETVAGVIEIATNVEASAATATDKALVPSNISSLDLSAMDNTTSAFISNITSESLNDLSDVSFTAGAGIDNYVLTYDNGTSTWGAEVVPSAPVTSVNTLTGAVVVSGNDIAADHTATNYTAANANVDGHFSGIDTKLGTLISDITGESLNDLSDVSFTAGAGIDNYVLTYDNGTSSWGAEAAPTAAAASETVAGVIEIATNAEASAATAPDKALVPSNISSLDLSAMNNTTSAFISGISGESLNDLSDVSFTAGAGIDNYVLTYDNGTSTWGAEVVPSAPVTSVNTQTGAVVISGNDVAADHTAVNYTAANANVDGHLSGIDTKLGTLISDITGESLNDLSDVSFTAGAGIDNFVLTYDNGTSTWGAEAVSIPKPTVTAQNSTTTLSTPSAGVIEEVYTVNSASAVILTLVSAATVGEGFKYQIKRLGTGAVTVDPASTEYIDYSGQTTFSIGAQYDSITLISDGTNWLLI